MDDLTECQLTELRGDLAALAVALRALLDHTEESAKPVTLDQAAVGRVSRVDAIQAQQMSAAARRRADARLGMVLSALNNEDYGRCRRCDEPIGFRRLKASPEAPFCVGCATELEK